MESDTREAMTPDPEMTLESAQGTIAEYEKPHVSRTVEETIQCQRAIGFLSGHAAGVKESSSKYTPLMSYVRHRDNCSWKKETRCACRLKKWIYRLTGAKE